MDATGLETMKSRKDDLKRRYKPLNMAVRDKPPTAPNHSTFVTDPKVIRGKLSPTTTIFKGDISDTIDMDKFVPIKLSKRQITSKFMGIFNHR